MELIDGRGLKALLQEHLDIDALIGLPKLPLGWQPRDIQRDDSPDSGLLLTILGPLRLA